MRCSLGGVWRNLAAIGSITSFSCGVVRCPNLRREGGGRLGRRKGGGERDGGREEGPPSPPAPAILGTSETWPASYSTHGMPRYVTNRGL